MQEFTFPSKPSLLERAIASGTVDINGDATPFGPGAPGSPLHERLNASIEQAGLERLAAADPPAAAPLRAAIDAVQAHLGAAIELDAALTAALEARLAAREWREWPLADRVRFFCQIGDLYIRTRAIDGRAVLPGLTRLYRTVLTPGLHPGFAAQLYDRLRAIAWMTASDAGVLNGFGADVVEPLAEHARRWAAAMQLPRRTTLGRPPYRMAYLSSSPELATNDAVARVIWSCLHGHSRIASDRIELFLYAWKGIDEGYRRELESLGVTVRAYTWGPSPCAGLARLRGQIAADRIDVLLTDNNTGVPTVLFETRSAPVQIYLDMGFSAWAGTGVDYTFLGFNGDTQAFALAPGRWEPVEWRFDERFVRTACDPREVAVQRARFDGARHVFCFVGRLVKLTPDYLHAAREILRRAPHAALYLGGVGDDREVRETLAAFGGAAARVVVDAALVDGPLMMHATDTFLDSFPFFGGLACLQAQGAGRPVVHLADPRPGYARLQALSRDEALRAGSIEDYVAIAERLATIPDEWAARSAAAASVVERSTDVTVCARAIEAVIERLLRLLYDA